MQWALMAAGVFVAGSAAANWALFMEHPQARLLTTLLGRGGARIFYGVVGLALFILGGLMAGGIIV